MKANSLWFIFFILLSTHFLRAQDHNWCGFDGLDTLHNHSHGFERDLQKRVARGVSISPDEVYLIPVVVHVVHSNSIDLVGLGDNISDEQIFSAIEVLNEDFRRKNADTTETASWAKPVAADMQIEFRLATQDPYGEPTTGITRHKGGRSSYHYILNEKELKSYGYWPNDEYLNIWVAPLNSNIVGFAQFPNGSNLIGVNEVNGADSLDGIVVAPYAFGRLTGRATGNNNSYRYGRTAVHEVGHWLGLRHIFNNQGNGCNYSDYCEDTPPQDKSNIGYSDCATQVIGGCGAVVMHQNYMDYSNDVCMNLFTNDQKNRAHAAMEVSPARAALKFSKGLCGSSEKMEVPFRETFESTERFESNWEVQSTNETLYRWNSGLGELKSTLADYSSLDSIVLKSGVINYENNKNLILRFDALSSLKADSVKLYFERACSGNITFLETINLETQELKDVKVSLKGLTNDGSLQFYFVVYNNENEIVLDNISIYEEANSFEVELFPNPTEGVIHFNVLLSKDQDVLFYVYDIQGRKVYEKELINIYSGLYKEDLSLLKNGMYLIRFQGADETITQRLLKQ